MIGKKIGRYQIKNKLGQGGMATVYRAYDPNFAREVAIKVLPPQFLHDSTFRARFRREAQTIASLEHHAIVPVYDFGEDNGLPFIVMRLMRGGSLADKLAQGVLSLAEAARILGWLAPALDEAHGRGIIHRDLKPGNILFDRQHAARIADFGIAKLTQSTQSFSATGGIIGTPQYMSPQQWRGEPLDGRSDVYALGVILFQTLTGQRPYAAATAAAMMFKHLMEPIPNILSIKPNLPRGCQQVIEQVMAKEPNQRYSTATALATDLAQLLKAEKPTRRWQGAQSKRIATPRPKIQVPNLNLGIGSTTISPKDGMVMLYVPAGHFIMGQPDRKERFFSNNPHLYDDNAFSNESPQHTVYLDGYWIDQTPITNRMFAKFITETGYQTQAERDGYGDEAGDGRNWQHPDGPKSNLARKWDHPVVWVNWYDAQAYSRWAGRRLPTEAEWEKAARGSDGQIYPWGYAEPNDQLLNFNKNMADTTPVSRYPAGGSPYGVLDMMGNVSEWTADWYHKDYYKKLPLRNPRGPTTGEGKVNRASSWNRSALWVGAGRRFGLDLTLRDGTLGFRCAVSPE